MAVTIALYPRDDRMRLGMTRKEEGRGFANNVDCVDATIWGFEEIQSKERPLRIASNSNDNIREKTVKEKNLENKNGSNNNRKDTSSNELGRLRTR